MMMLVCKLRRHSSGTELSCDGLGDTCIGICGIMVGMRSDEVMEEAREDGRLLQNYSDYPPHAQDSMRI